MPFESGDPQIGRVANPLTSEIRTRGVQEAGWCPEERQATPQSGNVTTD